MFFVTRQTLRASINETPEGRVYYATTRTGYVIDAATERNLARALTAYFFALVGMVTICAPLGSHLHHQALTMVVGVAAVLAIRYAALRYVLRDAPRSATPFSHEDAVHRAAATYGADRIWLMVLAVLLTVPGTAITYRDDSPWERAAMMAISLAAAIYTCVFAVRVLRAKAVMAREPAAEDHA